MRKNRVKQLWREGKPAVGGWLSIPGSFAAECMAQTDVDWLCIDMQHGCIDYSDVVPMLAAVSTSSITPFVRVPWNEPYLIMKVLDAGAYGVIVPMVNNRVEAERAVGACRYPPTGMRSNGPTRATFYGGADYQKYADEEIACVVMIETMEAFSNLGEILDTPGVDAAYIGPSDLALALGLGLPPLMDNDDPRHVNAVNTLLAECRKRGVVAGIHTGSAKFTQRFIDQGFQMVMLASDRGAMMSFMKAETAKLTGWTPKQAVNTGSGGY
jgi:4-hydroxy-2-oxoheptanedioate aldolase